MTEEPVNEYYLKLSERFGTLSVVLLMILPVFLFVAIFLNRKQITSDNLSVQRYQRRKRACGERRK